MEFASTKGPKNPILQYSECEADISDDELQSLTVDGQVIENYWILNAFPNCVLAYLDFLE